MKRMKLFALLIIILTLSACAKAASPPMQFALDDDGNYTGFKNLPQNYTKEQAEKDGCYVRVDQKAVAGEQRWKEFVEASSNGKDSGIRIVDIFDNVTGCHDLFYQDGCFRIFTSDSEDLKDYQFKYLLVLKGTLPNAAKSGTVTIITDDRSLTYKDVMWTFLSSDSNYSKSISPFKIVMFE